MNEDQTPDDEPTQPLPGWRPTEGPMQGASQDRDADPDPDSTPTPTPGSSYPNPRPQQQSAPYGSGQDARQYGTGQQGVGQQPSLQPGGQNGPHATRPMPSYGSGPGPWAQQQAPQQGAGPQGYGYPGFGGYAPRQDRRAFPGWVWPAVAALALVLGLLGGVVGAAFHDLVAGSGRVGTVSGGLQGVRTQEAAPLESDNGSVPAVAQALLPSTVQIVAAFKGDEGGATGSGFVLDREGHVVTNNHVVASAAAEDAKIVVIDHLGARHEASVVGRSPVYDLAVLMVEGAKDLEPAALGSSEVLHVGDSVVAFGSPLGLSQTVTSGIVSALDRPVTTSGEADNESSYINAVQTDAAINPGNSGGPLVNLAGEVVGVNSAIATTGGVMGGESGNIGVGFAIPIEQVRTTVDQILRTGEAKYPVIGAQVSTGGEGAGAGALITEIVPGTPAEQAGLKKDDVIVAVDDHPVTNGIGLIVAIRTHLPGDKVEMSVRRAGKEQTVEVELDGEVG